MAYGGLLLSTRLPLDRPSVDRRDYVVEGRIGWGSDLEIWNPSRSVCLSYGRRLVGYAVLARRGREYAVVAMDKAEPERFVEMAIEASLQEQRLRVILFDGEIVEGFCTATDEDASTAALPGATPLEEATFGPPNREITIDGRTIPAADIASMDMIAHRFRVSLSFGEPQPRAPGETTPEAWSYDFEASGPEVALGQAEQQWRDEHHVQPGQGTPSRAIIIRLDDE